MDSVHLCEILATLSMLTMTSVTNNQQTLSVVNILSKSVARSKTKEVILHNSNEGPPNHQHEVTCE